MKYLRLFVIYFLLYFDMSGQSVSFKTFMNPVIPGDHPDPTLTKIGNYFYTSGSSFNPTPKIYRSTDLVHWEVIAQPVSASWNVYGDSPGGGIWGGHMVLYKNTYWHFFGKGGGNMYFVTASQPEGPWSAPTVMRVPPGLSSGLGVDNSIFIDDDTGRWYLLTKAGQENNHIVELGNDGQPNGNILDLRWLNPNADGNPYGWAEGPVMWKHNGYYYYSFAQHLVGAQYVMRSDTLTQDKSAWTIVGTNMFTGPSFSYRTPNHISPVVMLDDSTSWTIAHSYNSSWYAQGRQGLLCQVTYNAQGFPVIQYPANDGVSAPNLPSSGIPWMVPKSDMFNNPKLSPNWSFLGFTTDNSYSLTERPGWLSLKPYTGYNTVIQNDGEHNYSLITRVDFEPQLASDEAGLWIMNGPQTLQAKVFSTVNSSGQKVFAFSFNTTSYETENKIDSTVWFKLIRNEHMVSGFYSSDGFTWIQIGEPINAAEIDLEQTQFNNFTGNQQGLYVKGKAAYFDLYIYRDAYSNITAQNPANRLGVTSSGTYLGPVRNNNWAMYAGVEFGGNDYKKTPLSIEVSASSSSSGGVVEVWLDSIDTGRKIAECQVDTTGGFTKYKIFKADVDSVSGSHDVYLRFLGTGTQQLFRINWFRFLSEHDAPTSVDNSFGEKPGKNKFQLYQNFPNPFNPETKISFSIPSDSHVSLKIFDLLGKEIATVESGELKAGNYLRNWEAQNISSGVYFYRLEAGSFVQTKKLILLH